MQSKTLKKKKQTGKKCFAEKFWRVWGFWGGVWATVSLNASTISLSLFQKNNMIETLKDNMKSFLNYS